MQDKIVIAVDKNFCKGCDTCLHEPRIVAICNLRKNLDIDLQVEKTPENFDEVKQLLKEHIDKLKLNMDVWEIKIYDHFIDIEKKYVSYRVRFTDVGNILFDSYLLIATDKRPSEIWQIIKALIGE